MENELNVGIRPAGCSLHKSLSEHKKYIDKFYKKRNNESIPKIYESIIGNAIEVSIKDDLFNIFKNGNLKLSRSSTSNLIDLEEIIIK